MNSYEEVLKMSTQAVTAMLKGAMAHCPGCKIDRMVPINLHGAAVHTLGSSNYECHANSEAWKDVPEFKARSIPGGALPATIRKFENLCFLVEVVNPPTAQRFMDLDPVHVFAQDRRHYPIEGYVVVSTTNDQEWWTFFEHGWEHGELF